jgi:hypothetical protein
MKKKLFVVLVVLSLLSTPAFALVKESNVKQDITVTWIEGVKGKDGYIEVLTRSRDTYRIYPCGKVEKLTWKEIAPNTEVTTTYSIVDSGNSVLYYDGNAGTWRGR